jgi:hypothetical protein
MEHAIQIDLRWHDTHIKFHKKKLMERGIHRQQGYLISPPFFFSNKGSRLKLEE